MCGSPKKDFFTSTVALYATNIALFPPTFALPLGNKVRLVTIKNLFKAWLTGLIDYALGSNIRRDRSTSPHAPCRRRWKYNKLIRFVNKKNLFQNTFFDGHRHRQLLHPGFGPSGRCCNLLGDIFSLPSIIDLTNFLL